MKGGSMRISELLDQGRKCGYIETRRNAPSRRLAKLWRHECERTGRVFARITPRRRWASINIDLFPAQRTLSPEGQSWARAVFLGVCERLPIDRRVYFTVGADYLSISDVAIPEAPAVMARLLGIIAEDLAANEWRAEAAAVVQRAW